MFRTKTQTSLQRVLLSSFMNVLLIAMCLFMVFAISVLFRRIQSSTQNLLNRSMTIAWEEYNRFFEQEKTFLTTLAAMKDTRSFFHSPGKRSDTVQAMQAESGHDFWLIVDRNGEVLATNLADREHLPAPLQVLARDVMKNGAALARSDVFSLSEMAAFPQNLVRKSLVKVRDDGTHKAGYLPYVLVQLAGAPVRDESGVTVGCLIAGRILNNDTSIAQAYTSHVPGSFLSIGVEGVRVAANIRGTHKTDFVGMKQPDELVKAIKSGKRYVGTSQIEHNEVHLVTTEPISTSGGRVIGALSVGIPPNGVTTLKRDTFITMLIALLVCFSISLTAASFISRRLSRPIASLSRLADEISDNEWITEGHVNHLINCEASNIKEIDHLQNCFKNMTITLFEKCKENDAYMEELEQDRIKLHLLTEELQEANTRLEKRVEERTQDLERAVRELKTLNHLKTQFLANMSHELRTPLHSIIGFSEMLHDELYGELNPTQKDYIAIVLNSARHLLQIISDILDISCIESDKITLYKEEVAMEDLIKSVVTIMRPQAEEKGLSLITKTAGGLPRIYLDPSRIKQVLSNLLSNSIKFTPEGGLITVEAFQQGDEIGVAVSDTGIGIKEEHQKNVFNEFYQCEDPYRRRFEGVGLGLPLSKKLVELHHGRIEMESTYGAGTKITFFLPLLREPYEKRKEAG
ncbi:MAG TPA: hypothetical protein GXX19_01170 [Syntrophomonadaceae bacterium]|nr:hypothetical protein [Syntrophomonadaceae bacterium]